MASGMDQGSNLCSVIYNLGGLGPATAPAGLSVIPLCQMELPGTTEALGALSTEELPRTLLWELGAASRQPQAQASTDGHTKVWLCLWVKTRALGDRDIGFWRAKDARTRGRWCNLHSSLAHWLLS